MGTATRTSTGRAAVYARQSLDRSGEGAAIDRQVADCRRLAAERGWEITHVLSDNDVSASTDRRRPQYDRLLNLMLTGQVDTVIVWHVDRLARRLVDLEQVIRVCETTGTRLATVTGDLDLSTDVGQLVARILGSVVASEVKRKSARQRAANRQRRERGIMEWTIRPFGYQRDADGRIVVVEDEAAALKEAAQMVRAGGTLAAAARMLNARGLPTTARRVLRDEDGNALRDDAGQPRHGPALPWTATALRRALLNPRYSGTVTYLRTPVALVDEKRAAGWPVILDADLQAELSTALRDVRRRLQQGTEPVHLLSGLAVCGRCDGRMLAALPGDGKRRWGVYRCRACTLARRADLVDEVVEGVPLARLARPDAAALLAPDEDVHVLRAEAVELRRRRDDLAGLLADGLLSREAVAEQATRLTRRIAEVEDRIAAAIGDSPAAALIDAHDVTAAWAELDMRSKKQALDLLLTVTILPAGKGARFDPDKPLQLAWKGATR